MLNLAEILTPPPPPIAPDRADLGDQYDIKIDDLRNKLKMALGELDQLSIPQFSNIEPLIGQVLKWGGDEWVASDEGGSGDLGLTLWSSPQEGELGYISNNNTLDKAIATDPEKTKIYGAVTSSGSIVSYGPLKVLFEPALTLSPNDSIFLSASMPGRATNIAPQNSGEVIKLIGFLRDNTDYNNVSGSALLIMFRPEPAILIP